MEKVNGFGIASLVLGIVGILLGCLGIGAVFGLIGLVLGILGLTVLKNSKKGLAIAGTILSGIALLIGVGLFATGFASGLFNGLTGNSGSSGILGGNNGLTASYDSDTQSTSSNGEMEGTYEDNNYFDIVEKSSFVDVIGTTHVIHKVKGKKNATVSATMIAKDSSGNVIGKGTDEIVITKGENNYFQYLFESDVSNAKFEVTANTKKDSFMTGERSAVVMEKYNKSGDDLYVSVKQVGDDLSSFAKYKILFYKGGKIVDTEYGYFDVTGQNLSGKGTTDTIKVWVFGKDFDKIEFIYEP